MNNKVAAIIFSFIAGTSMLFVQATYAATYPNTGGSGTQWVTDLGNCYTGFDVTDCTAGGGLVYGAETCDVVGNVTAVGSTASSATATTGSQIAGGGFYYDCIGADTTVDYDNWLCRADSTNVTNHVQTVCDGAGSSNPATLSNGSATGCLTNYTNCAGGDDGICEVKYAGGSETAYPAKANAIYTASCSATCDATHLSCTGTTTDAADDADGCEITENSTAAAETNTLYGTSCTARVCDATHFLYQADTAAVEGCLGVIAEACTMDTGGLPGTCTGAGSTGTIDSTSGTEDCACGELDIPEFAAGGFVDAAGDYTQAAAEFSTSDPLLWGKQTGTGSFIDFSDGSGTKFSVDKTGKITAGFIGTADLAGGTDGFVLGVSGGTPQWIDPGNLSVTGDNLGNHIATQTLKMGVNAIVNSTGTNGIEIINTSGDVTMDGNLTVATGMTVTAGGLTVSAGDLAVSSGNVTASGNLTVNGTGISTFAGDVTISDGDLILGDADDAGTIQLSDGSSNTLTLQTGAIGANYTLTLPGAAATDATGKYQVLTATNAGVMSWTNVVPDTGCASGDVMTWNGTAWACINLAVGSAQTLDVAYDAGNQDAASRTVAVSGDAIKFDGGTNANDIFQFVKASGAGDIIDIINQGTGHNIRVNDGTKDIFTVDAEGNVVIVSDSGDPLNINASKFKVDANGNLTITSTTGSAIAVNTDEFVVDTDGNTILKQLRLISSAADGAGKPTATCDTSTKGNIAYVLNGSLGYYYGCKQTGASTYVWVSMEVFGG